MFRITTRAVSNAISAPLCSAPAVTAVRSAALARAFLHSSSAVLADFTVVVPHMSESISEGIVSSLPLPVGSPVAVDQIVCELETDKVTFQVRSTQSGVLKSIVVAAGDTVPVGAPLLILDTDGKAAAAAPPAPPQQQATPQAAAPVQAAPATASSASHSASSSAGRTPSIKFRYGKREEQPAAHKAPAPPVAAGAGAKKAPAAPGATIPGYTGGNYNDFLAKIAPSKAANGKSYLDLPPAYGRPPLSPAEMAAIESGGAY